jgi:hypothetical protein
MIRLSRLSTHQVTDSRTERLNDIPIHNILECVCVTTMVIESHDSPLGTHRARSDELVQTEETVELEAHNIQLNKMTALRQMILVGSKN